MEELASLIPIIIIAVISAVANANKNKQKQQPRQQHPYQSGTGAAPAWQNATRPAAPMTQPAAPSQQLSMAQMLPQEPMQPTVHVHLEPDCETHDAPQSGSLGAVRTEGKDPCHEDALPPRRPLMPEAAAETRNPLLDFSGDAMVRAFVMQEVLTRSCDRRRR